MTFDNAVRELEKLSNELTAARSLGREILTDDEKKEQRKKIFCIELLNQNYRDTLTAFYITEGKVVVAAKQLHVSLGTLYRWKSDAIKEYMRVRETVDKFLTI